MTSSKQHVLDTRYGISGRIEDLMYEETMKDFGHWDDDDDYYSAELPPYIASDDEINKFGPIIRAVERDSNVSIYNIHDLNRLCDTQTAYPGFIEKFARLQDIQQENLLENLDSFESDGLAAYVFVLSGYPLKFRGDEYDIFLKYNLSNFEKFHKIFKLDSVKSTALNATQRSSGYSSEFRKMAMNERTNDLGVTNDGVLSLLFLLRELYGEQSVLEVMAKRKSEAEDTSMVDVLRLLQNWSAVKDYPIAWAVSISRGDFDENFQKL